MKFAVTAVLACSIVAPHARGQKLDLKLDSIAQRASGKTEVDLDGPPAPDGFGKSDAEQGCQESQRHPG